MRSAFFALLLAPAVLAADATPRRVAPAPAIKAPPALERAIAASPVTTGALSVGALCEELHKAAAAGGAVERAQKEERARLEKLAADVAAARAALRSETARLDAVVVKAAAPAAPQLLKEARHKPQIDSLAKTFAGMKPQKAAALLAALEPGLATSVLQSMAVGPRGAVLEKVAPEKAAELVRAFAAATEASP